MPGSAILEVFIGLIFVYLILSLICTAVQEIIASALALRSKNLKQGIANLLAETREAAQPQLGDLAARVYDHPLVRKLAKAGNNPSYIPARTFALALLDTIKDPKGRGGALAAAENSIARLPDGDVKTTLSALVADAQGDLEKARRNIETWFDDSMDRVVGWYARKTKWWLLGISFALAVSLNVDSIVVAQALWREPALRQAVAANAAKFYEASQQEMAKKADSTQPGQSPGAAIKGLQEELAKQDLPIGWEQFLDRFRNAANKCQIALQALFGWILTALAASLGAPFWFDLLGKFLNIRGAGKKPEKPAA